MNEMLSPGGPPSTETGTGATVLPLPLICRWAAALMLRAPDATELATYRTPEGVAFLQALRADGALAPVGAVLAGLVADEAALPASARRLEIAHSRAFLMGGPRAAPPYASVWLSPRALLWQQPARDMARLLAETGLVIEDDTREPPDHLAIQLDLLAVLTEREAAGAPVPISVAGFIRRHLLTWLPELAEALNRGEAPFFYPELVAAIDAYLRRVLNDNRQFLTGPPEAVFGNS